MKKDPYLDDKSRIEYLSRKIYYLGTYFKIPRGATEKLPAVSEKENEFRVMVNLAPDPENRLSALLPSELKTQAGRHYIKVYFDPGTVKSVTIPDTQDAELLSSCKEFQGIKVEYFD